MRSSNIHNIQLDAILTEEEWNQYCDIFDFSDQQNIDFEYEIRIQYMKQLFEKDNSLSSNYLCLRASEFILKARLLKLHTWREKKQIDESAYIDLQKKISFASVIDILKYKMKTIATGAILTAAIGLLAGMTWELVAISAAAVAVWLGISNPEKAEAILNEIKDTLKSTIGECINYVFKAFNKDIAEVLKNSPKLYQIYQSINKRKESISINHVANESTRNFEEIVETVNA